MSARRCSSISRVPIVLWTALWTVVGLAQTGGRLPGPQSLPLTRGEALFLGKLTMQGKPRGHQEPFPAEVVRCVNCHATGKVPLNIELLTVPRQRRGGPPSAYDEAGFCKLLHTGIDPVYVMIDHAMPIYDMPASECAALWTYITRKENSSAAH